MYTVIICTRSTGRVRRKDFKKHQAAIRYANKYRDPRFAVEIVRNDPQRKQEWNF